MDVSNLPPLSLSLSPCHREDLIDFRRWASDEGGEGEWIKRRFPGSLIVENEGKYWLNIRGWRVSRLISGV